MDPSSQVNSLYWPPTTPLILTGLIRLQYPLQLIQHRGYRLFPHSFLLHPVLLYPLPLFSVVNPKLSIQVPDFFAENKANLFHFLLVSFSQSQAAVPLVSLFLSTLSLHTVLKYIPSDKLTEQLIPWSLMIPTGSRELTAQQRFLASISASDHTILQQHF